jgi:hypothetical protein
MGGNAPMVVRNVARSSKAYGMLVLSAYAKTAFLNLRATQSLGPRCDSSRAGAPNTGMAFSNREARLVKFGR